MLMKQFPTRVSSLQGSREGRRARRRALARRESSGAVIFIVAMTLGVLAVMGVYALSATTSDLRAAGNMQRGAQANYINSYGAIATAEYITYDNADDIVYRRMLNPNASATSSDRNCISTQKNVAALVGDSRTKSCVRLSAAELRSTSWCGAPCAGSSGTREAFTSQSFTHSVTATQDMKGDVYTELTNPTAAAPPPGYDVNSKLKFVMVTATTYGIVKPVGPVTITTRETLRTGRGRFIIGPIKQ